MLGDLLKETPRYSPPDGYYDQPFAYVYDGSGLTDGSNALNQTLRIQGGWGDFILRRIVGLGRVLPVGTGQFNIYDNSRGFLASNPTAVTSPDDIAIPHELLYPEKGRLRFDLLNVQRPVGQTASAQLAFMGVRRQQGRLPDLVKPYSYRPEPEMYVGSATINSLASSTLAPVSTIIPIRNYGFDLQQIILLPQGTVGGTFASYKIAAGSPGQAVNVEAQTAGVIGNAISINVIAPIGNGTLSITTVGNQITVFLVSPDGISVTTTTQQFIDAVAANAAASALIACNLFNGCPATAAMGATFYQGFNGGQGFGPGRVNLTGGSGGGFISLTNSYAAIQLYDAARDFIFSNPILDIFINGAPGSPYQNGAIVPQLFYPVRSQIRMDFTSMLTAATAQPPVTYNIYLVGQNRIPC